MGFAVTLEPCPRLPEGQPLKDLGFLGRNRLSGREKLPQPVLARGFPLQMQRLLDPLPHSLANRREGLAAFRHPAQL